MSAATGTTYSASSRRRMQPQWHANPKYFSRFSSTSLGCSPTSPQVIVKSGCPTDAAVASTEDVFPSPTVMVIRISTSERVNHHTIHKKRREHLPGAPCNKTTSPCPFPRTSSRSCSDTEVCLRRDDEKCVCTRA